MFKMLFIGYLFGIRSETRLAEDVKVNIAYRLTDLCQHMVESPGEKPSKSLVFATANRIPQILSNSESLTGILFGIMCACITDGKLI